jgi:hypothetical protein
MIKYLPKSELKGRFIIKRGEMVLKLQILYKIEPQSLLKNG